MRFSLRAALLTSLVLSFLGANTSLAQPTADSLSARLRDGHIETTSLPQQGAKIRWGKARAVVDAPLEQVMAVVQDYGNYSKFLPHFHISRVLAKRGNNAIAYMEAHVLKKTHTIWVEVRFRERPAQGRTRIIEGKMNRGNVNLLSVRWEATPLSNGKTLLTFQLLIDPDLPLPSSIINDQNAISARRTVRAVRKRVYQSIGQTT